MNTTTTPAASVNLPSEALMPTRGLTLDEIHERMEILAFLHLTVKHYARRSTQLHHTVDWHERILFDRSVSRCLNTIERAQDVKSFCTYARGDFARLFTRLDREIDKLAEHVHVWELRAIYGIDFSDTTIPRHIPKRTLNALNKKIAAYRLQREQRNFFRLPRPNAETVGIAQKCTNLGEPSHETR